MTSCQCDQTLPFISYETLPGVEVKCSSDTHTIGETKEIVITGIPEWANPDHLPRGLLGTKGVILNLDYRFCDGVTIDKLIRQYESSYSFILVCYNHNNDLLFDGLAKRRKVHLAPPLEPYGIALLT